MNARGLSSLEVGNRSSEVAFLIRNTVLQGPACTNNLKQREIIWQLKAFKDLLFRYVPFCLQ